MSTQESMFTDLISGKEVERIREIAAARISRHSDTELNQFLPWSDLRVFGQTERPERTCLFCGPESYDVVGEFYGEKFRGAAETSGYSVLMIPVRGFIAEIHETGSGAKRQAEIFLNGRKRGAISIETCKKLFWMEYATRWKVSYDDRPYGEVERDRIVSAEGLILRTANNRELPIKLAENVSVTFWSLLLFYLKCLRGILLFPFRLLSPPDSNERNTDDVVSETACATMSEEEQQFYFTLCCWFRFMEIAIDFPSGE